MAEIVDIVREQVRDLESRQEKVNDEVRNEFVGVRNEFKDVWKTLSETAKTQDNISANLKIVTEIHIPALHDKQSENKKNIDEIHEKHIKMDKEITWHRKILVLTAGGAGTVVGLITSNAVFQGWISKLLNNLFK